MLLSNPLWHYAIALYQRPGVEALCLALQAQGLSVNRLLLCCWLAVDRRCYQAPDPLTASPSEADQWRQAVLEPLRRLRYQVRDQWQARGAGECYRQLRQAELAAEQLELAQLWQQSRHWPLASATCPGWRLARANLQACLAGQPDATGPLTGWLLDHLAGLAFPASGCDDRRPDTAANEL